MSANQDPSTQQMMYQQQSYAGYQPASNSMGTWGQPQQTVPYAVAYHGDASYADKAGYGGAYPPLQQYTTAGDAEYYRFAAAAQQFPQTQQTGQWATQTQQTTYPQTYGAQQPAYGVYSTGDRETSRAAFNPGAPPPNMNRPPPALKRENQNGENTFHATLSMLENPAQNSAAYTASWVSSTSSIPPELKDEPEFGVAPREDVGNNVFSGTFHDQFNNMSIHDGHKNNRGDVAQWDDSKQPLQPQQWPGLGQAQVQQQQQEEARQKKQVQERERNQRPREEARVMTWDERVRKARAQAERAEQRSAGEREAEGERGRGNFGPVSRGGRGSSRGIPRNDGRGDRGRDGQVREWRGNENGDNRQQNGSGDLSRASFRGRGGLQNPRGGLHGVPMLPMFGQPPMMMPPRGGGYMRGGPHPPPPPHMMNLPQDERFKNTWLDANVYVQPFPMPFPPPMAAFGMDPRFGNRGRGRGGNRGMRSGSNGKRERMDGERKEGDSGSGTPGTSNEERASPAAENTESAPTENVEPSKSD